MSFMIASRRVGVASRRVDSFRNYVASLRLFINSFQLSSSNEFVPLYIASDMESSDDEDVQTALVLGLILRQKRRKSAARRKRSVWVRPLLQMRTRQGTYNNLIQEMRLSDPESHFSFLRMSKETFDVLLQKVNYFISC